MKNSGIHYTGVDFDRAATLRKDQDWVDKQFQNPKCLFIPIWQNKNLVTGQNDTSDPGIIYLSKGQYSGFEKLVSESVFLGFDDDRPIFALDISGIKEEILKTHFNQGEFINLRLIGQLLKARDAARLAYARGIIHWHNTHQFCSKCGSKSINKSGGHLRLCSNMECGKETFPRTDPAVIMLVEYRLESGEKKCLLGRHTKSPEGMFSTLAGFVDPGESLEEAVVREVFEEAGIRVGQVTYQGSQPWPFPASIMLGFRAQAETININVDPQELAEAKWFSADELINAGEWGDKNPGLKISRKDSIARHLIDSWINEQL
ncbi:MAG: NAD(+) diphosphatase [Calditrichaeota bacterium]|nr:MAG: NAD(+) diphosphatase [Calditrichota bacterium]MBL1204396.1 NAD(+) diphosphatase [Calditrichota bacterium]NOG44225.1 NAD(+) diphosphatase [Calditrichota bacterium]